MYIDNDKRKAGMTLKELDKLYNRLQDHKVKCTCSHTLNLPYKNDRVCCTHCGHWVYKDEKTEFKYKMREMLLNGRC